MDDSVYQTIKATRNLPTPRGIVLELLRLAQDDSTSLAQMAALVEKDPAIATRVLKMANSPFSGISRKCASISQAVGLLGIQAVTRLALCFSLLADHRRGRCPTFPYDLYWADSLGRAAVSQVFAQHIRLMASEEAFTLGLLSQIGRLAFATAYPEEYGQILTRETEFDAAGLARNERARFQWDHNQLSSSLLADWGLPAGHCRAVRCQLDPEASCAETEIRPLARLMQLSGTLSAVLTHASLASDVMALIGMQSNRLGVAPGMVSDLFDRATAQWKEAGRFLAVPTSEVPSYAELYARAERLRSSRDETDVTSELLETPA
jgi:HD-like signal output (HDOD) protein